VSKELKQWKSIKGVAGKFKEVNVKTVEGSEKLTRFALVTIDGSGHMVCLMIFCDDVEMGRGQSEKIY